MLMAVKTEKFFQGSGVSPGMVLGKALKLDSHNRVILKIHIDDVENESSRFLRAVEASREQLEVLKERLEEKMGSEHGIILDAHLLMLEDRNLNGEVLSCIRESHANAEWAIARAMERFVNAYESLEDEYFRERHNDIENVFERILQNLSGDRPFSWEHLPEDLIIVSHDFNPSMFATMDLQKVRGLVLESGGRNSHTAILSRGLRLPAVMGIRDLLASIVTGDSLLLNGDEGWLIVNPTKSRIDGVRGRIDAFGAKTDTSLPAPELATMTQDGVLLSLRANTELPHETREAKRCGAEGIGMFRSEFLFFGHPQGIPSMEEQFNSYRSLVQEMSPHPVAIRTLDAGSEKVLDRNDLVGQANPSMGLRGIRLSLRIKDAFRTQIEAILRAAANGPMEIVLPMVSMVEEIWQAKALIDLERTKLLQNSGIALDPVPLGVMIEVPAAVLSLEVLAKEVDFLCVGTNDLIQYMLAVDRGNPHVAYLFQPLHPSILSCLRRIADVAASLNKPVRICGEISSNPYFAVLLLGMGFTQLSMNPLSIPTIRKVLHEVSSVNARKISEKAQTFVTAQEVWKYLVDEVSRLVPMDLTYYAKEIAAPNGGIGTR
jgi:phosphoenolpyruvate-protein phosphotransferase (PTS system enzyme I)